MTTEQAELFNRSGFFVLDRVFGPDTVSALLAAIDPLEAELVAALRSDPSRRTSAKDDPDAASFVTHVVARSPWVRGFCASALFRDLATDLLGPTVRLYWDQAVYKKTERPREFPWHQDNGLTYIRPQNYLTCWIALTDATVANGCLWILPGTHRTGMLAHEETEDGLRCVLAGTARAEPVEVSAGSVVVFSSLTPHRSGPNLTSAQRKAYIVQYALDGSVVPRDEPRGIRADLVMDDPVRQYLVVRDGLPVEER